MNRKVEKLIPRAIDAVKHYFLQPGTDEVKKEYDGYAASLGAAIRTSGLLPALTFYTDVSRSYPFRSDILEAIHYCLDDERQLGDPRTVDKGKPKRQLEDARSLMKTVLIATHRQKVYDDHTPGMVSLGNGNEAVKREWTAKIVQASIALKLAMRNFKHTEE
jgi:hypothetical protein